MSDLSVEQWENGLKDVREPVGKADDKTVAKMIIADLSYQRGVSIEVNASGSFGLGEEQNYIVIKAEDSDKGMEIV